MKMDDKMIELLEIVLVEYTDDLMSRGIIREGLNHEKMVKEWLEKGFLSVV